MLLPTFVCIAGEKPRKLYTHDWPVLVEAAQLNRTIRRRTGIKAIYFALADAWGPSLRYQTKPFEPREGERLYKNMAELYQFLRESTP